VNVKVLIVTNIYPTARNPVSGPFVEQQIRSLRETGLTVEVMLVDRAQRGMGVYLGLGRKVRERLSSFDADLVHSMYGGVMAAQVVDAVKDRPTVVTFHGSDLLGERLSGTARRMIAGVGVWASVKAARQASGTVVVSHALKRFLLERVHPRHVRVIPCGVDLEQFKTLDRDLCRQRLGWDKSSFHVLFPATNGNPVKRPDLARAAVEAVHKNGMKVTLHYLQSVPHGEVPIWLNASDVLIMTSLHEGSPTVVKEALACQIPIVSVDVGDVSERIAGVPGCYLAEAEPGALASKLSLVFAGPGRLPDRTGIKDLSLGTVALRLSDFYDEVVKFWRSSGRSFGAAPSEALELSH
jgi:glycosyltransferase involved in cell wall biosynthesis